MAGDSSVKVKVPTGTGITNSTPNLASSASFQSIKRKDSGSGTMLTSRAQPQAKSNIQQQIIRQQKLRDDVSAQDAEANGIKRSIDTALESQRLKAEVDDANKNAALLEKRLEAAKKLQSLEDDINRKRSNTFTSIYSGSTTSFDETNSFKNVIVSGDIESATWKLGDILQSLGDKDRGNEYLVNRANDLVTLLTQNPELKDDLVLNAFGSRIQILLTHQVTEVRACGYRVARYILRDEDTLRMLIQLRIELFMIISLSKDNRALLEKEQALKLIRQLIELPDGVHTLTIGIVRAIVAIAESTDDKLRAICIETLCEISLYACSLVYKADGLKVILQSFIEGPYSVASTCLITVLSLLGSPESRSYVIDQVNISYFVSSFCDIQVKGHNNIEKLQNNAFMLTVFLKTWPGLICISQDNFSAMKDLINCLAFNIPNLRDILMDIFFDILKIRTLPWIKTSNIFGHSQQQSSLAPQQAQTQQRSKTNITPSTPEKQHPVVNHYIALLLSVLLQCNITDKLVSIISDSEDDLNKRKAIYLLAEIVSLSSNLIPVEILRTHKGYNAYLPLLTDSSVLKAKVPSVSVFQMARLSGRLSKGRVPLNLGPPIKNQGHEDDKSKAISFRIRYNLDDLEFKKLLNDTRILTTKEYDHWNWDLISELIQGPLMNGRRLEETIRSTKVMKRLMSFFRPFKFRFSKISSRHKNAAKYVRVGCEIFEMLLHTDEGVKFLAENKLLAQIAECIAQVDPYSGITSTDSLFSKHKLETTMSSGYFKMLGVLSKDKNGLKMMEQWKIFSMFYHITEAKRDDLIKLIISDMDYKLPSHLRVIFTKVLTTSHAELRIFTTNHLSNLLYHSDTEFITKLLMDQLYDSNRKVIETAVKTIDEYIADPVNLDKVIDLKPNLYQLGKVGHTTLLRFLSTSKGYHFLNDYQIIDRELQEWIDHKIFKYVFDVENLLIHDLIQPQLYNNLIFKQTAAETGAPPPHFFGELVKIDEGVKLISSSGLIEKIARKIKSYVELTSREHPSIGEDEVIQLKGYLWCVGHICSTEEGIELFANRNLIEDIITLSQQTANLSIKGTCFLVMGLISKTYEGLEILDECRWCCKANVNKQLIGICLPLDLEAFFKLDDDVYYKQKKDKFENYVNLSTLINNEFTNLSSGDFILMKKIVENLNNLLSHLLASKSITNLRNIRFRNDAFFNNDKNNLIIFKILTKLLMNFKYSKNLRKFLLNDFIDCLHYLKILCRKDRQKMK